MGRNDLDYRGKHNRVQRVRGSAGQFPCVDACGRQAKDWSQRHGTSGDEPEDYDPRCRKCHAVYDAHLYSRGEHRPAAKLTEARVRGIKASVGASLRELAAIHGVSIKAISDVRKGRAWRHVK